MKETPRSGQEADRLGDPVPTEPSQREALADIASRDGQAREFRGAVMQALTMVNQEIAAGGEKPRTDAVIQALTMLQAEFVAMDTSRIGRERSLIEIGANLSRLVALRLSTGAPRPAKPLSEAETKQLHLGSGPGQPLSATTADEDGGVVHAALLELAREENWTGSLWTHPGDAQALAQLGLEAFERLAVEVDG